MAEIKTDMFPEVLRMRAKEKQEDRRWNRQESVQINAVLPVETVTESVKKEKNSQEQKQGQAQ
jgi:hypothetical protein